MDDESGASRVPVESSSPAAPETVATPKAALGPDEMRRRRLAKLNTFPNSPQTDHTNPPSNDPPAKLSKNLKESVQTSLESGFSCAPIPAVGVNIKPSPPPPPSKPTISSLALCRKICGAVVEFKCSDTEFESCPCHHIGQSVLQACFTVNTKENNNPVKVLEFLSDLFSSASINSGRSEVLIPQIQLICSRYALLLLTGFMGHSLERDQSILYDCVSRKMLSIDFLSNIVAVSEAEFEPGTTAQIMVPFLTSLKNDMMTHDSLASSRADGLLALLGELCEIQVELKRRPVMELMPKMRDWLPPPLTVAEGRELQRLSFLGPFLGLSCLNEDDPEYGESLVPSPKPSELNDPVVFGKAHLTLNSLRMTQFNIVHALLVNQATRGDTLDYLANVLTRNMKRAQMAPDRSALATDGFMLNVLSILCNLERKVPLSKVDKTYLTHPLCRFLGSSETHLRMSEQQWGEYCDQLNTSSHPQPPRFNTECFFLTLYGCHTCIIPCTRYFPQALKMCKQLKSVIAEAEKQYAKLSNKFAESKLNELREQYERYLRNASTYGAVLFEEKLLAAVFQFYGKLIDLILSIVTDNPQNPQLPLAEEVPKLFASYPEFVMEDIAELVLFCTQYAPNILSKDHFTVRSLVNFLVVFLCSANYISNPYRVAQLVEVVFVLHPSVQSSTQTIFNDIIDHAQSSVHLAPSLIRFYSDIESTGASSEFYDKFTIRYHLTIIFKSMWAHSIHKRSMIEALNSGGPFVRFVNLLINDTTFLLDESLECIKRIHETQQLMKNRAEWDKLGQEAQNAKKKQLTSDEGQCKSYMTLVNETLNMFHYITLEVKKPFLLPEIIGRLAAMLNCYVAQFCGPKYNDLNVENRDKYSFQPKTLLNQITDLYLHLDSPELVNAVAADDRSYDKGIFEAALDRMRRTVLKPSQDLERFARIASDAEQAYINNLRDDADFDDAPDHYRDPITEAIMTDPVQLPSGKIMDRSCVTRILLDNAIDPFSRQPLSLDLIKECPDLKAEINLWKQQKLASRSHEPMNG